MRFFLFLLSWAVLSPGILAEDAPTFTPRSVAVRSDGTLIISDDVKYRILGLDPSGVLTVQLERGTVDPGSGRKVDLGRPVGIALDGADNLYLTDRNTHRIFRIDRQSGAVTTVAGNREFGYRYDDVAATETSLSTPVGVALDREGNLYFVEQSSRRVRRVDPKTGQIATVAGSGRTGFSGDGGPATEAAFEVPFDVAVDRRGNLYIADTGNHRIRRVDAGTGLISTYAGDGKGRFGGDGGPAARASLYDPFSVALDRSGNLYIADRGNHRIRRVGARKPRHHHRGGQWSTGLQRRWRPRPESQPGRSLRRGSGSPRQPLYRRHRQQEGAASQRQNQENRDPAGQGALEGEGAGLGEEKKRASPPEVPLTIGDERDQQCCPPRPPTPP